MNAEALLANRPAASDPEIHGITADSREVRPGYLFVALSGAREDGRRFVDDAVRRGAAAILSDPVGAARIARFLPVPVFADTDPRRRLALAAAKFYAPQPAIVAAVTGTNGKTSTAAFLRQFWAMEGHRAASIGTLGIEGPGGLLPGSMTTPDPVALHANFARLVADEIDRVVLEASSHGLDQHRLDGVTLTAAAFTNLTQDHLDYHGDMARYLAAKLRLFRDLLPPGGIAVLNADIPEFDRCLAAAKGRDVLDYGSGAAAIRLVSRSLVPGGQVLDLRIFDKPHRVTLGLVGAVQAMNVLAALGLAIGTGVDPERAVLSIARLQGVRGRFELVATLASGAPVFVDYAHTPDGLEKLLASLRPHTAGRLICVFGAGGDRDPTKRPLMGEAVARLADLAIVTDDNPRFEDPAAIRAAILAATAGAIEIGDRAQAIEHAMRLARAGDVVVIAGKGHETGQTVAGVVHPFDDSSVAREIALRLGPLR
jgi:UDP-N-acetylmuramoyl-L-alanyl-D-glutamate--2,6-diaminopimelate ligase